MPGHSQQTDAIPPSGRRLGLAMGLNFLITAVELIGGMAAGSLALISDALHNFSDGASLILSYIALRLSARPRNQRYTFGLKRAQILAAIINAGVFISRPTSWSMTCR